MKDIRHGFVQDWVSERYLATRDGDFQFRRLMRRNNELQAVYRMVTDLGMANYYGLVLATNTEGDVRIIDFDDVMQRSSLATFGRVMFTLFVQTTPETPGQARSKNQVTLLHQTNTFLRFKDLVDEGSGQVAIDLYQTLPPILREDRLVKSMWLRAATNESPGGEQHRQAWIAWLNCTPDPLSRGIHSMLYYSNANSKDHAILALQSLHHHLGADAWVDSQIAEMYRASGRLESARSFANRAVQLEPSLKFAHDTLCVIATVQGDYAAAVEALQSLDTLGGLPNLDRLENHPDLQQLVASQNYTSWKHEKFRGQRERQQHQQREANAFFDSLKPAAVAR